MSTWADRDVPCPACKKPVRARIARGVHVNRVPHVRDQVLDRTFHRFTCACGETFTVDTSFEYTDLERKQLLFVAAESRRAEWPALEDELVQLVVRVRDFGSPLVHWITEGLTTRVVFGLEELREKLVLWQYGFDDGLIECIKVRAWANDVTLAEAGARLVVDSVTDEDGLVCNWLPREGKARRVELPSEWVRDAHRDRESLAQRLPELFKGGFVSISRLRG